MTLWDVPHNGTPTSRAAAARAQPTRQEQAVIDALRAAPDGLTREELEDRTGLAGNAIRPRVWALVARGIVYEQGERPTRAGRAAAVVRLRRYEP